MADRIEDPIEAASLANWSDPVEGEYVLAGTGSRSLQGAPLAVKRRAADLVTARLEQARAERGDRLMVMSGMAEGFDKLLAVTALRLGINLWCAIPNGGYGRHYWGRTSLTGEDRFGEFCEIRDAAWRVTHVMEDIHHCGTLHLNGRHANMVRNDWMVVGGGGFPGADDFAVLGPVRPKSGTADCVESIRRVGKWRDDMMLLLDRPTVRAPGSPLADELPLLVGQGTLASSEGS